MGRLTFSQLGGILGFFCNHAYAYNSRSGDLLPDSLKGLDMVIWETFRSLGIEPAIHPVIKLTDGELEGMLDDWKARRPRVKKGKSWVAWQEEKPQEGVVGKDLHIRFINYEVRGASEEKEMYDNWQGNVKYKDVTWLNKPTHRELQLLFITVRL
jgi:hypothetical protein